MEHAIDHAIRGIRVVPDNSAAADVSDKLHGIRSNAYDGEGGHEVAEGEERKGKID